MKRLSVVGPLFLFAGILAAAYCALELPSGCSFVARLTMWLVFLTGPAYASLSSSSFLGSVELIGWCGFLLGLLHPLWPTSWMSAPSAFGWLLWFGSGFLTVLFYTAAT